MPSFSFDGQRLAYTVHGEGSDAGMLAEELPHARLLQAHSIVELRVAPRRLTDQIARFVDECWRPRPARARAAAF